MEAERNGERARSVNAAGDAKGDADEDAMKDDAGLKGNGSGYSPALRISNEVKPEQEPPGCRCWG